MPFVLAFLPPPGTVETHTVLRKAAAAHRYLAELKGVASAIPNESILINMLVLQEAKDSSAVENIITTHDDLFRAELFTEVGESQSAKEVQHYASALKKGFELVQQNKILTLRHILTIQEVLEQSQAGFRRLPGTTLRNQQTGEVVYTPPQDPETIIQLMGNLQAFINDDSLLDADPLVKMALIHYQFESIHPFYDGNGRTGRILNILYLIVKDLLNLPTLYLSRYIIQSKGEYYRRLQAVRDTQDWESWIIYMLEGVATTAKESIVLVQAVRDLMQRYKEEMKAKLPKIYSQDLLTNLFRHPYTKIEFIMTDLQVSRLTATRYLDLLTEKSFVEKHKMGRSNYYINQPLLTLFLRAEQGDSMPGPGSQTTKIL